MSTYQFVRLLQVSLVFTIPNTFSTGFHSGLYWGNVTACIPQCAKYFLASSARWMLALSNRKITRFFMFFQSYFHQISSFFSKSMRNNKLSLAELVTFQSTVYSAPSSVKALIAATPNLSECITILWGFSFEIQLWYLKCLGLKNDSSMKTNLAPLLIAALINALKTFLLFITSGHID